MHQTTRTQSGRRDFRKLLGLTAALALVAGFASPKNAAGAISVLIQPTPSGTGAVWTVEWDNFDGATVITGSFGWNYSDGSAVGLGPYGTVSEGVVWENITGDVFGPIFSFDADNALADGFGGVTLLSGSAQPAVAIGPDHDGVTTDDLILVGSANGGTGSHLGLLRPADLRRSRIFQSVSDDRHVQR